MSLRAIILFIFQPLFLFSYWIAIILYSDNLIGSELNIKAKNLIIVFVFLTTALLPLFSILLHRNYLRLKFHVLLEHAKHEKISLWISVFFYSLTAFLVYSKFQYSSAIFFKLLINSITWICLLIVIVSILQSFLKISLYTTSLGSLLGFVSTFGLLFGEYWFFIILIIVITLSGLSLTLILSYQKLNSKLIFLQFIFSTSFHFLFFYFFSKNLLQ